MIGDVSTRRRSAAVNPKFGTMIILLSESFPHQFLAAQHPRHSIAGWFCVRDVA